MGKSVIGDGKNLFESYDKQEIDAIAEQKANADDVYNKSVIDAIESGLQESIGAIQQNLADNYYQSSFIDTFFAKKNGEYDELTAGFAKQLISKVRVTDSAPYLFRTSGGALDIGNREFDKLIGGSIAWNQKIDRFSGNGATYTTNADGSITVTSTGEAAFFGLGLRNPDGAFLGEIGHKYYCCANVLDSNIANFRFFSLGVWADSYYSYSEQTTGKFEKILAAVENRSSYFNANVSSTTSATTDYFTVRDIMIIDLTQMFGATIADYIYNLESANAGAGVEWFRRLFPLPYYEYNAGELMSVKTSAHKMVGFNAWDEETRNGYYNSATGEFVSLSSSLANKNPIKVLPNTVYYAKSGSYALKVFFYDANMNFLQTADETNKTFTTPANCYYINFSNAYGEGSTYNNDICINLSWDGERNGEYEPYKTEYYPLAQNLELRGIPKLDASNNLYYDGDEYESNGDVIRKFGVVDLGSLTWYYNSGTTLFYTYGLSDAYAPQGNNTFVANAICPIYFVTSRSQLTNYDKAFSINYSDTMYLSIRNTDYTDPNAFKTAMSGVYLVYELATPTTETAAEFATPQFVDDFGTEQYIDERPVAVPVGHVTEYEQNLRAKLEMSPDSPANDGLFLMQHNNGENSYVPYISPIPALPTTNGVYSLKCTVTGGVSVLAWIEDTATRNAPDAEPETENENEK